MDTPPPIRAIDEQAPVQRRIWAVSRIAWALMAVLLALGTAGLFGDGPLAEVESDAPDGSLHLRYDRFQRADAVTLLTVQVNATAEEREMMLCFDRAFLKEWRVGTSEPAPRFQENRGEDVCGLFLRQEGERPAVLRFWVAPRTSGLAMDGALYRPGRAPAAVGALVWP